MLVLLGCIVDASTAIVDASAAIVDASAAIVDAEHYCPVPADYQRNKLNYGTVGRENDGCSHIRGSIICVSGKRW